MLAVPGTLAGYTPAVPVAMGTPAALAVPGTLAVPVAVAALGIPAAGLVVETVATHLAARRHRCPKGASRQCKVYPQNRHRMGLGYRFQKWTHCQGWGFPLQTAGRDFLSLTCHQSLKPGPR